MPSKKLSTKREELPSPSAVSGTCVRTHVMATPEESQNHQGDSVEFLEVWYVQFGAGATKEDWMSGYFKTSVKEVQLTADMPKWASDMVEELKPEPIDGREIVGHWVDS